MAEPPLLSVVMTAYRGAAFIGRAIESVLRQGFTDFELIIVEDASGDDTLRVIRSYDDARLRVIAHSVNQGISVSRNDGLAAARGQYIAMHDQDDVSLPNRFAASVAALEANPQAVLSAGRARYRPAGSVFPREPVDHPNITAFRLFTRSNFYTSAVCFRAAALRQLDPVYDASYPYAEDFVLYHELGEHGDLLHLTDITTEVYKHGANASIRHEREMSAHAKRYLKRRYETYLDHSISEQEIADIWRLGNEGLVLASIARTGACGKIWNALVPAFIARRGLHPDKAQAIRHDASRRWWHLLKLSAQKLGPEALRLGEDYPHLTHYQPPVLERLMAQFRAAVRR